MSEKDRRAIAYWTAVGVVFMSAYWGFVYSPFYFLGTVLAVAAAVYARKLRREAGE